MVISEDYIVRTTSLMLYKTA